MPPRRADQTVEIVGPDGNPDLTVAIVGDQVLDLAGATEGDVPTVGPDGTLVLEPPAGGGVTVTQLISRVSGLSIANDTFTVVTFNQFEAANAGEALEWDAGSKSVLVNEPGLVTCTLQVEFDANATGWRLAGFDSPTHPDVPFAQQKVNAAAAGGTSLAVSLGVLLPSVLLIGGVFPVGLEAFVRHTRTAALNIDASFTVTHIGGTS